MSSLPFVLIVRPWQRELNYELEEWVHSLFVDPIFECFWFCLYVLYMHNISKVWYLFLNRLYFVYMTTIKSLSWVGKSKHNPSEWNNLISQTHKHFHENVQSRRKWLNTAPWCPDSRLPVIGDALQESVCWFREVRGHQDLHWVDLQDSSLQLRARLAVRETVQ